MYFELFFKVIHCIRRLSQNSLLKRGIITKLIKTELEIELSLVICVIKFMTIP